MGQFFASIGQGIAEAGGAEVGKAGLMDYIKGINNIDSAIGGKANPTGQMDTQNKQLQQLVEYYKQSNANKDAMSNVGVPQTPQWTPSLGSYQIRR